VSHHHHEEETPPLGFFAAYDQIATQSHNVQALTRLLHLALSASNMRTSSSLAMGKLLNYLTDSVHCVVGNLTDKMMGKALA